MADRKELDMDNLDEVAGGAKKSKSKNKTKSNKVNQSVNIENSMDQNISGQNDNQGVQSNVIGNKNKSLGIAGNVIGDGNISM